MVVRIGEIVTIAVLGAFGCGHRALTPFERELNVMARFVEARRCHDAIAISRTGSGRASSLSPQLHTAVYDIEQCGQTWRLELACNDGPHVVDAASEGKRPRCVPVHAPAIDESLESWLAPELIALFHELDAAPGCPLATGPFQLMRSERSGDRPAAAVYTVTACGATRRAVVECRTFDLDDAHGCRVRHE